MYPRILHLYGPLWINSYGFMIALGFVVFTALSLRHPWRKKLISAQGFIDATIVALGASVIGGRVLFILENPPLYADDWREIFYPWMGGFSLLGSIIATLIIMPLYLRLKHIPILPFFDLASIYTPLLQSIARIGCFLAGCCYGIHTDSHLPWAVQYTHPDSLAPLHVWLHPAQLYSSLASFIIFLLVRFAVAPRARTAGQTLFSYLALEGMARFIADYWRGEYQPLALPYVRTLISLHQFIALSLIAFSIAGLIIVHRRK